MGRSFSFDHDNQKFLLSIDDAVVNETDDEDEVMRFCGYEPQTDQDSEDEDSN